MKGIILQASARSTGYTAKAVAELELITGFDVIDLNTKNIAQFDYDFKHSSDDFLLIMRKITSEYDVVLFATPVYWYSMSGLLKAFFDRITDCLDLEKETGRKLRGMTMGVISNSQDESLNYDFEMPFRESASYLGMRYSGHVHVAVNDIGVSVKSKKRLLNYSNVLLKGNSIT